MKRAFSVLHYVAVFVIAIGIVVVSSPYWLFGMLTKHDILVTSDGIVLLAGAMNERVPAAASLYRDGYATKVLITNDGVFSSWSTKHDRNLHNVEWAEEKLVMLGVPRKAITKLPFLGNGTVYEALATKREMSRSGMRKIIVTTSDYHTYRARWIFRQILKEYPAEVRAFPAPSLSVGRKYLALEGIKVVYYKIRFGLLSLIPE